MIRLSRNATTVLLAAFTSALLVSVPLLAQHPGPQPRPGFPTQSTVGDTTTAITAEGQFPPQNPFTDPPGSNFLLTVESNIFDSLGVEIPNTLPSSHANPWNLHVPFPDGSVVQTTPIDPQSPSQALRDLLLNIRGQSTYNCGPKPPAPTSEGGGGYAWGPYIDRAIDILEGNPMPAYVWSGFPLLHYTGPLKVKAVDPITRNVDIHQIWYDSHIESDTAYIDPSAVLNQEWTITYTVDVLYRGHDDFSPFVMYFDPDMMPGMWQLPHVAMDQTFYPMEEGTRNVFKLKMAPGKYYNLTYTWGWRIHPPRVQATENARKDVPPGSGKPIMQWEIEVFGANPRASEEAKLAAIAKIGDLSPAKRMWNLLREARGAPCKTVASLMTQAVQAYDDWFDRTELPTGAKHLEDPNADLTLLYVNNTIYGKMKGGGWDTFWDWQIRPQQFKVTLYNGDHFPHAYMNVDFGGSRGWENQFEPTLHSDGGIGCKFTFGRVHWWMNTMPGIMVPPVDALGTPGKHKVNVTLNHEPNRRLRMYQFDPLHHDVAVFSLH